jgi:hypothetical protein
MTIALLLTLFNTTLSQKLAKPLNSKDNEREFSTLILIGRVKYFWLNKKHKKKQKLFTRFQGFRAID